MPNRDKFHLPIGTADNTDLIPIEIEPEFFHMRWHLAKDLHQEPANKGLECYMLDCAGCVGGSTLMSLLAPGAAKLQ
jgi:hypothetical protein